MAALTRAQTFWLDQSGAELIEFALTLPLLLLLGLGIFDFGILFQRYHVVTNAAREGARIAVLPGYADADVDARVRQYVQAGGLVPAQAALVIDHSTLPVNASCVVVTTVTVTYPYSYSFVGGIAGYLGATGFTGGTLGATAQMRNEVPAIGCP
jgi:Flp pilus assembly protein TadG